MKKIGANNANIRDNIRKGAWTGEEDNLLRDCIHKHGEGHWHRVPQRAGLNRCRKSCRLRWLNYLKPNIKRGQFSEEEIDLIIRLHRLLGNKWSLIAGRIPGRTANDVKNYWNTHLHKKLSPLSLPLRPNTLSGLKSKNITMHSQIIRPQPSVINKPDPLSSLLCRSNGLDNGATEISVLRDRLVEEEEDDNDGKAQWWENLVETNEKEENEKPSSSIQVPCSAVNHEDGTPKWDRGSGHVNHVQELNVWEEDDLWNFDVNMWD